MIAVLATVLVLTVQHPGMPAGMTHEEHMKQMQKDAELKKQLGPKRTTGRSVRRARR